MAQRARAGIATAEALRGSVASIHMAAPNPSFRDSVPFSRLFSAGTRHAHGAHRSIQASTQTRNNFYL